MDRARAGAPGVAVRAARKRVVRPGGAPLAPRCERLRASGEACPGRASRVVVSGAGDATPYVCAWCAEIARREGCEVEPLSAAAAAAYVAIHGVAS